MLVTSLLSLLALSTTANAVSISPPNKPWIPLHPQSIVQARDIEANGQSQYEYVVVGSGAGGGPVAARLALNGFKVLLIEAGDDQGPDVNININTTVPAFHAYSTEDERLAWSFYVNHYQDPARARRDDKMVYDTPNGLYVGLNPPADAKMKGILYPRSGTLGGCSGHNAMVSIYPHEEDWNNIARLTGDSSWNASNMRRYFERLEDCLYCPPLALGQGKKGWLGIDRADLTLALKDIKLLSMVTSTAAALGQGILDTGLLSGVTGTLGNVPKVLAADINSDEPGRDQRQGLYQIPIHTRDNARNDARTFVVEVANAKNPDGSKQYALDVLLNTLVTKVTFGPGTNGKQRATGVQYMSGKSLYKADPRARGQTGTPGQVSASREVIVAGGAYNTPQILKLSGVGPKEELARFNIPVVADLPGVGRNLQDHFEVGVIDQTGHPFEVVKDCTYDKGPDACLDQWKKNHKGPYQSNGFFLAVVKKTAAAQLDPDILMFGGIAAFRGYYPRYSDEVYGRRNWTWAILRAHTDNRSGTVALRSADPTDTPVINFNYFDTAPDGTGLRDVAALTEAVGIARKTFPHGPLAPDTFDEIIPGKNVQTQEQIQQYVKDEAWGHHASCSAPIGADNDPYAVLDGQFRVRGVQGLRVVDASVFPRIPGFFIVIPTFMIAEKAADVITASAKGLL